MVTLEKVAVVMRRLMAQEGTGGPARCPSPSLGSGASKVGTPAASKTPAALVLELAQLTHTGARWNLHVCPLYIYSNYQRRLRVLQLFIF